jgi:hypothetical protein
MITLQELLLGVGLASLVPSAITLIGVWLINSRFNGIETRLINIEGDLRQFYREQGRHEGEINMLKERGA